VAPHDLVNPFKYLASEAGKVIADGWTSAMLGLWNAGLWALRLVLNIIDSLLTPDLSDEWASRGRLSHHVLARRRTDRRAVGCQRRPRPDPGARDAINEWRSEKVCRRPRPSGAERRRDRGGRGVGVHAVRPLPAGGQHPGGRSPALRRRRHRLEARPLTMASRGVDHDSSARKTRCAHPRGQLVSGCDG
jgi:hypothetical protein